MAPWLVERFSIGSIEQAYSCHRRAPGLRASGWEEAGVHSCPEPCPAGARSLRGARGSPCRGVTDTRRQRGSCNDALKRLL